MKSVKILLCISVLLIIGACSDLQEKESVKEVRMNVWEGEERLYETDFIYQEEEKTAKFIEAADKAEKLDERKVIKTPPLLTYSIAFQGSEKEIEEYHLWLTKDKKGYIQSLIPNESLTYQLKEESVVDLINEINYTPGIEPLERIEFE